MKVRKLTRLCVDLGHYERRTLAGVVADYPAESSVLIPDITHARRSAALPKLTIME